MSVNPPGKKKLRCRVKILTAKAFASLLLAVSLGGAPGDTQWTFDAGQLIFSSAAQLPDGGFVFGTSPNDTTTIPEVVAVNADGSLRWRFQAPAAEDWFDSTPAIDPEGNVFIGNWNGILYALDGATGAKIWEYDSLGLLLTSPALDEVGNLYFGSSDGLFHAVGPSGEMLWVFDVGAAIEASAAIRFDGVIIFGALDGYLYALNPDGTLRWRHSINEPGPAVTEIAGSPALSLDGTVYFGARDNRLYAVEENGSGQPVELWSFEALDFIDSPPVLDQNGRIAFGSRDGFLYVLDPDGFQAWAVQVGDIFYSAPAIDAQGNFYIASFAGSNQSHVSAYDPDGALLWRRTVDYVIDASTLLTPEGDLVVGTFEGVLYNFEASATLALTDWAQFQRDPRRSGRQMLAPSAGDGDPPHEAVLNGHGVTIASGFNVAPGQTFTWTRNGVPLPGQSGRSLRLNDAVAADTGWYRAKAVNAGGESVSTGPILLAVVESVGENGVSYWLPTDWLGHAIEPERMVDWNDWVADLTETASPAPGEGGIQHFYSAPQGAPGPVQMVRLRVTAP